MARAFGSILLLVAVAWSGEPRRIIVLHTNDLHGQLRPLPPSPVRGVLRGRAAGGFDRIATMVGAVRREAGASGAATLLVDGGDLFQGTPLGNETQGRAVVDAMNALGYDAAAVGNHEFDFGVENLVRLAHRATFPLLAANLTGVARIRPLVVLGPPRLPVRVALIGLAHPGTASRTARRPGRGVRFGDPAAALRGLRGEIDADLFVVVSHLGRDADRELAAAVGFLDLVCGGHSHSPMVERVGRTLIVQTHARGASVARVDLDLDPRRPRLLRSSGRLLPVDPAAVAPDPKVAAVIARHARGLDARLARKVGRLRRAARRGTGLAPAGAGHWVADVIRQIGGAEIGLINRGGLRCDLEAGAVTGADLYRFVPFDDTVVVVSLPGTELRRRLAAHVTAGGRPGLAWSGLVIDVAVEEKTARLAAVRVAGEPLRDGRRYRVAMPSFLAMGTRGRREPTGVPLRDALARDLAQRSPLAPPARPRLRRLAAGR